MNAHTIGLVSPKDSMEFYRDAISRSEERQLDLARWLPSFGKFLRPLVPGEVCSILANTGNGKTAIVQNIALSCPNLNVILFELELPLDLVVERFLSISFAKPGAEIQRIVKAGEELNNPTEKWNHVWTCKNSGLTVADMELTVKNASEKIGSAPNVVIVDYAGLVKGLGKSKYEKMTQIAEDLKMLARNTETIVILTSQIHRQDEEEIGLHDAKDSGQIENSSGVLLGAWRDSKDSSKMTIRILKSTKGGSGNYVKANFDGPTLRIWE